MSTILSPSATILNLRMLATMAMGNNYLHKGGHRSWPRIDPSCKILDVFSLYQLFAICYVAFDKLQGYFCYTILFGQTSLSNESKVLGRSRNTLSETYCLKLTKMSPSFTVNMSSTG